MAVVTGTTTDTYHDGDEAIYWNVRNLRAAKKIVSIANTGTNTLDYKISVKIDENQDTDLVIEESSLCVGQMRITNITDKVDIIKIDVKSTKTGEPTTFEIATNYIRSE